MRQKSIVMIALAIFAPASLDVAAQPLGTPDTQNGVGLGRSATTSGSSTSGASWCQGAGLNSGDAAVCGQRMNGATSDVERASIQNSYQSGNIAAPGTVGAAGAPAAPVVIIPPPASGAPH